MPPKMNDKHDPYREVGMDQPQMNTENEVQRTDEEKKKRGEARETGCAIITLAVSGFIALIILLITLSTSIMLIRHDPRTPFIVIGRYESR